MHEGIRGVETVFLLLLLFVVIFGELARRIKVAYPIVLVIAGLLLSLVPRLPEIGLNPELVFLAVLPPLLFHAAWETSWRDFRYNMVTILLMAFGLVGFTVLGVALAGERLFSLLYWRTGFVLGAIVAPTDAIAAASIAKRVGLPQRITDVLEGESLVNDATGLLALEFGIAMVMSGETPSLGAGALRLIYLTVVGIGIGVAVGWVVRWIELHIDDGPIEMTLGLVTAYVAYIAAEEARASGVLAVVACGLYLSRKSAEFFSPGVRLQAHALWNAIDFVLNGLVFVLIGLQLPFVLAGLHGYSTETLAAYAAMFSALVIALRLLWIYPSAYLAHFIRSRCLKQVEAMQPAKEIFVTGWTGMRGVIALAAALSVPEKLANGQPFPSRDLIVFLTFSVILVTLVLQGLTLPLLIRALGLGGVSGPNREECEARRLMLEAALAHIRDARERDQPEFAKIYENLATHQQDQLAALLSHGDTSDDAVQYARYREISFQLLGIQRKTILELRSAGRINDAALRRLERELDLSETRMSAI
jgi:CPA1 family monovalent cation:H+ antiporter